MGRLVATLAIAIVLAPFSPSDASAEALLKSALLPPHPPWNPYPRRNAFDFGPFHVFRKRMT